MASKITDYLKKLYFVWQDVGSTNGELQVLKDYTLQLRCISRCSTLNSSNASSLCQFSVAVALERAWKASLSVTFAIAGPLAVADQLIIRGERGKRYAL